MTAANLIKLLSLYPPETEVAIYDKDNNKWIPPAPFLYSYKNKTTILFRLD